LGHIDDGPDGGEKKRDAQSQKYAQQFQSHLTLIMHEN
jgi:hypothetical protein